MNEQRYLRPKEATIKYNVSSKTLINWDNAGLIKTFRTKGGQRRYLLSSIEEHIGSKQTTEKRRICYCRVSTHSQKEDMERQAEFFRNKYPNHEIIKDIGSGINFKRKGLKTILEQAVKGNIGQIVVTHKDRLCRFGFDLIENIITQFNGEILVLDHKEASKEQELVDDLVSIITVFSSRIYGLRSHSIKKQIEASKDDKDKIIPN
jgi:putative resolvase